MQAVLWLSLPPELGFEVVLDRISTLDWVLSEIVEVIYWEEN